MDREERDREDDREERESRRGRKVGWREGRSSRDSDEDEEDVVIGEEGEEGPDDEDGGDVDEYQDVHAEAMQRFDDIQGVMYAERNENLTDRRFAYKAGAQWDGVLRKTHENKPRYQINKTGKALDQIMSDFQDQQIGATFASSDGAMDEELADSVAAVHRADMQDSGGREAHTNAYREMSSGGIGAWVWKTRYEDDEVDPDEADDEEPQRLMVEAIYEADRLVFFDMNSRRADKSDARFCFVLEPFTRQAYEAEYPDDDLASWPDTVHQGHFDWCTPDVVTVARYYRVEWEPDVRCTYRRPAPPSVSGIVDESAGDEVSYYQSELKARPELKRRLEATAYQKVREKKVRRRRIHLYIMNGAYVMSHSLVPGREIPVILVQAHRTVIDNVECAKGHVRDCRDPQQIKNMLVSRIAEISATSPADTPIVTPEMVKNHELTWAQNNRKVLPYLPVNPITTPDGRKETLLQLGVLKSPDVPQTTAALHNIADMDIKDILGNPSEGEKVVSHVSGKTVQAVMRRVDAKSAPYIAAMVDALRWSGQVYIGMVPEVYYQEGRRLKGVGLRNEPRQVELARPMIGPDGKLRITNDLSRVKMDVTVMVGPSSDSADEAALKMDIDLLGVTEDPEAKTVLQLDIMMRMPGEGRKGIRNYARKRLVRMGAEPPTPEEAQALEATKSQPPGPIDQLALAQAAQAMSEAEKNKVEAALVAAKVDQTRADTAKVAVDADKVAAETAKVVAETAKTHADADLERGTALVDAAASLQQMRNDASALAPGTGAPADAGTPGGSQS